MRFSRGVTQARRLTALRATSISNLRQVPRTFKGGGTVTEASSHDAPKRLRVEMRPLLSKPSHSRRDHEDGTRPHRHFASARERWLRD